MVFDFLCLTYFIYHNTLKVHVYCPKGQDLIFLWLNSIPLYIHTPFSLSIHSFMDTWVVFVS